MKLILVHGLGQSAKSWDETKGYLKEPIDVHCPELYLTESDDDFSYQKLYEKFEEYCEEFKEPIILCGLSLGGVLCLNYAIDHRKKVEKSILIGTQYKMPKLLLYIQNLVFRCLPAKVFHNSNLTKSSIIQLCKTMMHLDFSNRLQEIACDTLLICGEKDLVNLAASNRLSRKIKRSNMIKIANSGHEVNKDQARKLVEAICKFLQM